MTPPALIERSVHRGCEQCVADMLTQAHWFPLYKISIGRVDHRLCDRHLIELRDSLKDI